MKGTPHLEDTDCAGLNAHRLPPQCEFKGKHGLEYGWFAAGAATKAISIDAERAARAIVRATIRGTSEKILSMPAAVLAQLQADLPGLTRPAHQR
jgi:hypothetical protein